MFSRHYANNDIFFNNRCQELINFLQSRGYSRRFLKKELNCVRNIPRQETLKPRPQNNDSDRTQGRNEVYFLITDPILLPKILIPDPKSDENFDP